MAIRADASTEGLTRTANLPSSTAFTIGGWFRKRGAGDGSWESIAGLLSSGGSSWAILYNMTAGSNIVRIHGAAGDASLAVTLTTDTWYYFAIGCNGTTGTSLTGWIITTSGTVYTASTFGVSMTPAEMSLLKNTAYGEWVNGAMANVMVWSTKLTTEQLLHQMWKIQPVVEIPSLVLWSPLINASDLNDYSGLGRNWTSMGGTLATEDMPPVTWGAAPIVLPYVASGGASIDLSGVGNIAGAEGFGTPTIDVNLAPSGIASNESVGTQSIQISLANISGITSVEALGTPAVVGALAPAGIVSVEAFGVPTLSVNVADGGVIPSGEAVGSQSIQAGLASAGNIASAEAFGTPAISLAVNPASVGSGEAIGNPALSVNVAGAGNIASAEAFGTANVSTTAPVNLTDAGNIASAEAFGTPAISLAVNPASVGSGEAIGNPALSVNVAGAGNIASEEAFGTANVSTTAPVNLTDAGNITSAEAFGTPAITLAVNPANIGSGEALGNPALSVNVAGIGNIASAEAFGTANVSTTAPVNLTDAGNITSAEAFGVPDLALRLEPAGIASNELFGVPTFMMQIAPVGIAGSEAFGSPYIIDPFAITRTVHVSSRAVEAVSVSSMTVELIGIDAEDVP